MKVVILSGTPKEEGLSCCCSNAALEGVKKAGAEGEIIKLNNYKMERCKMCGDGWGPCREDHSCAFGEDGFTEIQDKINQADALVLSSPVYWNEMTEVMKSFMDRYRRCEALKGDKSGIAGKPVLMIASPGGFGNGMLSTLEQMDRFCKQLNGKIFDFIGVNRWNKEYKLVTIHEAAKTMVNMFAKKGND